MDLHVGATATLLNAADLRQRYIDQLEAAGDIIVDIDSVTTVDLSFLQLIHALRVAASAAGRAVRLRGPAPSPVAALLERAGFLAAATPQDLDFWFHGERAQ